MDGLKHYEAFKKILASYQLSDRAKDALNGLSLVLMLAPTSGGRNTTIRELLKSGNYYFVVSDTTRKPRINDGVQEENGVQYWFRSEEEILSDLEKGEFLEAELIHGQQVSGISIRELTKAKAEGKTAITDIDIEGMHNVFRAKPDTAAILLLPPSFEEWQNRLMARGHMRPDEVRRRMETAKKVFEDGLKQTYYHYVINESIPQAAALIDSIVHGGKNTHQDRGLSLLRHLLEKLETHLQQR